MSNLIWYWHRLRAMSPTEVLLHARRKVRQRVDARRAPDGAGLKLKPSGVFPRLPIPENAPVELRAALRDDAERILAGRWEAFGHLELRVDDPPAWQKDHLVGLDLSTAESAFALNHRELPEGADIRLIWELNRWTHLTRLAMAAHVLGHERAANRCLAWLEDWVDRNPAYHGWNWTSALEAAIRLVQFAWIDALVFESPGFGPSFEPRLARLRQTLLPAHVRFSWRYRSFGSSANNHLIGELTGLIVALIRWPELAKLTTSLSELQRRWEREVLTQFAEDGGNREQALNYHLFSWEFCWQARTALVAANRTVAAAVEERLLRAARFFWEVQARREPWDYGDSDNARVTPLFTREQVAVAEWRDWLRHPPRPNPIEYWLGSPPSRSPRLGVGTPSHTREVAGWWFYEASGWAVHESGFWWLRWDLSPLGFPKPAAHAHLDALHLSIWRNGVAMVIDPGTGAYYVSPRLRQWLASRAAHNGPCPAGEEWPHRVGPFLWSGQHPQPVLKRERGDAVIAELRLPGQRLRRSITRLEAREGWLVEDSVDTGHGTALDFSVRWQLSPGSRVKQLEVRRFRVCRNDEAMEIEVGEEWSEVVCVEHGDDPARTNGPDRTLEAGFAGTVSPAFRKIEWAPYLRLLARPEPGKPCVFRTAFLASPRA